MMRDATYQRMMEHSVHLYAVLHFDCSLKEFNAAWCDRLGVQPSFLLGRDWLSLLHEEDKVLFVKRLSQVWYDAEEFVVEARLVSPSGDAVLFSWRLVPMTREDQWLLFGHELVVRPSSDDRIEHLQRELLRAHQMAHQAQQIQSTFLANMSHELRTPLNAIMGYTEMVGEELEDLEQPMLVEDTTKILKASRHLLRLVNDLLDLSKMESDEQELTISEFSLGELFGEAVSLLEPLIQKSGNAVEIHESAGMVIADRNYLRQILLNLIGNANKFTDKGIICVRGWRFARSGREWVSLSVSDTGIGMSAEKIKQLFQPLSQSERAIGTDYSATGLGLMLSRKMCHAMGGELTVESTPGEGSTFLLQLPLDQAFTTPTTAPLHTLPHLLRTRSYGYLETPKTPIPPTDDSSDSGSYSQ